MTRKKAISQTRWWQLFFWLTLLAAYFWLIKTNFTEALKGIDYLFGYVDYQHNWRGLEDFLHFKIPFKDYYYEYGWLFLGIQAIGYLLGGRTFWAVLASREIFMPVLGLLVSVVIAKAILKKNWQVYLFLFFCLLFRSTYNYVSLRHLVAELSLAFFILFVSKKQAKHLLTSGLLAGMAVLSGLEYGLALNLTILLVFLSFIFLRTRWGFKINFYLGQAIILVPYFLYLTYRGAINNFIDFTSGFMNNYYFSSPCSGDAFPRLADIQIQKAGSQWLIFGLPIEFLRRLNFYLVALFLLFSFLGILVVFLKKRKPSPYMLTKLSLVLYGGLIFVRTLNSPCVGYFTYGLVPVFLLLVMDFDRLIKRIKQTKLLWRKIFLWLIALLIISWLGITGNAILWPKVFAKKDQLTASLPPREFYPPAGAALEKERVEQYREIANFITSVEPRGDFLYVYPWGPYNQITSLKPPNSLTNLLQISVVGEKFVDLTIKELEEKQPQLVVVNLYNNLGVAHFGQTRGDVPRFFAVPFEEGPVFSGEGTKIERFILENYETVLKNDLAAVMKKRAEPIEIKTEKKALFLWEQTKGGTVELQLMEKRSQRSQYAVIGKKASWTLTLEEPLKVSDIEVELELKGNFLTKCLTRYFLSLSALSSKTEEKPKVVETLARREWQVIKIPFSKPKEIKVIKIEITNNVGLIWWLNPSILEIKQVRFFNHDE